MREARPGAEGLLEDGRDQALRELDERHPRLGLVGAGPDDECRRAPALEERRQLFHRRVVDRARSQHAAGRGVLALRLGFLQPVVHRHDDDRRAPRRRGLVVGAIDRTGHVLRADRLVEPDRILAGEAARRPVRNGSKTR